MAVPACLKGRLALPVIGAPMFLVSGPELVIAQCRAGVVGAFPALNARPIAQFDEWLAEIREALAAYDAAHPQQPAAPYAVNLIVHRSNGRLDEDLALCVRHRVPLVITSLGARPEVAMAVRGYGGTVLHDVTTLEHARKAVERGADGLIAVAHGAGGHAGRLSPFALLQEIRAWWDGPLVLSGAIASGGAVLAAEAMGADLAYVGSAFIATAESRASADYKRMVIEATGEDVVYTPAFSGVPGNYLKASVRAAGFDPERLEAIQKTMDFDKRDDAGPKAWRDIWSAGQGVGGIREVVSTGALVARLATEYAATRARLLDT